MAITAVPIFNGLTLATGATKTSPYGGVTVPVQVTTLAGSATGFNFVIAGGATPCGPDATITFKYAFSMTDYSVTPGLATTVPIVSNSGGLFNLRVPDVANVKLDITTSWTAPILGNYMYCWLELRGFTAPLTSGFSAAAIPSAVVTVCHQKN